MKEKPIYWKDLIIGFLLGTTCMGLVLLTYVPNILNASSRSNSVDNKSENSGSGKASGTTINVADYETNLRSASLSLEDGTVLTYYTPERFYSLSDQYAESLTEYYKADTTQDNLICTGNSIIQAQCTILVNATCQSKLKEIMRSIYADNPDVNPDEIAMSEAYIYMTTGELPEGVDDSFKLEESETIVKDGVTYRSFIAEYDTEYYTDDTKTSTTTIHSSELMVYSDTADTVEIVCYMQDFDANVALSYVKEFIGITD